MSDSSSDEARAKLGEILRTASVSQVSQFARCDKVDLVDITREYTVGQVLSNYMILVAISGSPLQMLFKIHYNEDDICALLRSKASNQDAAVPAQKIIDFMKELGNQVSGHVCRVFASHEIMLGISIPLSVRGYNEIYSEYSEKKAPLLKFGDYWALDTSFGTLYCTSYIEVMDNNIIPLINGITFDTQEDEDDDEIDFL